MQRSGRQRGSVFEMEGACLDNKESSFNNNNQY